MVAHLLEIWTALVNWLTTNLTSVQSIFYSAETGFTLMGTLTAIGVAVSIVFVLIGTIANYVRLRG